MPCLAARWFLFLLATTPWWKATAQPKPMPVRIEALGHYGKIFKHTVNFLPAVNGPATGGELALTLQTTGKHSWNAPYGYPAYGLVASVVRFNNDSVLGMGYGFMPQVFIPVFRREPFQLDVKLGAGVAFLTKHFDIVKNPRNNVIATGVNNITSVGLCARYDVTPRWSVLGGASFTHYSTGDARLPNLGINVPMLNLGAAYTINPVPYGEYFSGETPSPPPGIAFKGRVTMARFEAAQRNGPIFTQVGLEGGVMKHLLPWNKLSLTADAFYNSYTYFLLYNQEIDRGAQFKKSLGLTVLLEDEVLIGRVGIAGAIGVVVYQPHQSGAPYYQQIAVQYHFLNLQTQSRPELLRNVFTGIYLKTHWANAEHVKVGLGIEW